MGVLTPAQVLRAVHTIGVFQVIRGEDWAETHFIS